MPHVIRSKSLVRPCFPLERDKTWVTRTLSRLEEKGSGKENVAAEEYIGHIESVKKKNKNTQVGKKERTKEWRNERKQK